MTLILTVLNRKHAVQVSDRRTTFGFPDGRTAVADDNENKAIYVIGPTGTTNAGRWQVIDANHIRDSSFSNCLYQRAQ